MAAGRCTCGACGPRNAGAGGRRAAAGAKKPRAEKAATWTVAYENGAGRGVWFEEYGRKHATVAEAKRSKPAVADEVQTAVAYIHGPASAVREVQIYAYSERTRKRGRLLVRQRFPKPRRVGRFTTFLQDLKLPAH